MILSQRIRSLRIQRKLSQGDMEEVTGLRRQYISRVENGRTMPSIDTLEKLARALGVPLYRLFYDGVKPATPLRLKARSSLKVAVSQQCRYTEPLLRLLVKMRPDDRRLLMAAVQKMAQRQRWAQSAADDDGVAAD